MTAQWLVVAALRAELPRGLDAHDEFRTHALGHVGVRSGGMLLPGSGDALIITGTCGALRPGVKLGTLVMPQRLIRPGLRSLEPNARLRAALLSGAASEGVRVVPDPLVEVNALIDAPSERARAAGEHHASFVDMESASLALEAEERGIPWAVLRIVSDSEEQPLAFLTDLFGSVPTEQPGLASVARALARRPWHLPRLVALGWALHVGRGAVGRTLVAARASA